uniref:Uncharacterized protein n=1 Tax=Solanum tuberosum TaxID=4113 RepID=M1AUL5_SOLTU
MEEFTKVYKNQINKPVNSWQNIFGSDISLNDEPCSSKTSFGKLQLSNKRKPS